MPNNIYKRINDEGLLYLLQLLKEKINTAGEENVIEIVKVNGTALTPDAQKAVNVLTTTITLGNSGNFVVHDNSSSKNLYFMNTQEGVQVGVGDDAPERNLIAKDYADQTYRTEAQVQQAIDDALADITEIDFQVVQTLPASGTKGVIYLVPITGSDPVVYDEYIWIEPTGGTAHFEKIGSTDIDLSGYVQASEMHALTNTEIDDIFNQVFNPTP